MIPAESLLTRIVDSLLPSAGALAGFLLALLAFEFTEWRRRLAQRNAIRSSLRAELRSAEVVLTSLVTRFAVGVGDMQTAVRELRWQLTEGWSGGMLSDMTSELQAKIVSHTDADLEKFLKLTSWKQRNVEVSIPLPIVQAVLSSSIAGLSSGEMEALTRLSWQSHLLDYQARSMEQTFSLTFTVKDAENHAIVVQNHESAKEWYRKRAGFMLDAVREALHIFDDP